MKMLRWVALAVGSIAMTPVAFASGVTRVEILGREEMGTIGGHAVRRLHGMVHGSVDRDEPIAGLAPRIGSGATLNYAVPFEVIAPVQPTDAVVVEVENRGRPTALALLAGIPTPVASTPAEVRYPSGLGNGFPLRAGVAYARVAWQAGVTTAVPVEAQGVGQAILRDFGRWLGGAGDRSLRAGVPKFRHRVLIGISQSAWMANALIAEGFNRDPISGRAVYQGVFTRNGAGNVLAVNAAAHGGTQTPYILANAAPLTPSALLRRPGSDPVVVDILAYTDFFRLRASLFAEAPGVPGLHRYAVAAAHAAAGAYPTSLVFGTLKCNGGRIVALNPISDAAYVRSLLTNLLGRVGVKGMGSTRLPPDRPFLLDDPGEAAINGLHGRRLLIPRLDKNGMPIGGIPLIEAMLPLGRPVPPALSPLSTRSIADVCGNFGGWAPFSRHDLVNRYGDLATYEERLRHLLSRHVAKGWIVPGDRDDELKRLITVATHAFEDPTPAGVAAH